MQTQSDLLEEAARRHPDRAHKQARFAELLSRSAVGVDPRRVIKIAGTNGKGSVCAMLKAALLAGGKHVGVFTSPHLQRVTERIRVDGREIESGVLDKAANELEPIVRAMVDQKGPVFFPSFFEILLVVALRYFEERRVEYVVLEAGIGGRQDATSLVRGFVSAITTVSPDHEAELGGDLSGIAREKAGIATPGSILALGVGITPLAANCLRETAESNGVTIRRAPPQEAGAASSTARSRFQLDNLGTALAILREVGETRLCEDQEIHSIMLNAAMPGRFELLGGSPSWLLDGAHNPEAMAALAHAVKEQFAFRDRVLVFGLATGKDATSIVKHLCGIAGTAFVVDSFHRAADRLTVARLLQGEMPAQPRDGSVAELVGFMRDRFEGTDTLVLVTGSLFLVGAVREALGHTDS